MKKKILAILLAAIMVFAVVPATTETADAAALNMAQICSVPASIVAYTIDNWDELIANTTLSDKIDLSEYEHMKVQYYSSTSALGVGKTGTHTAYVKKSGNTFSIYDKNDTQCNTALAQITAKPGDIGYSIDYASHKLQLVLNDGVVITSAYYNTDRDSLIITNCDLEIVINGDVKFNMYGENKGIAGILIDNHGSIKSANDITISSKKAGSKLTIAPTQNAYTYTTGIYAKNLTVDNVELNITSSNYSGVLTLQDLNVINNAVINLKMNNEKSSEEFATLANSIKSSASEYVGCLNGNAEVITGVHNGAQPSCITAKEVTVSTGDILFGSFTYKTAGDRLNKFYKQDAFVAKEDGNVEEDIDLESDSAVITRLANLRPTDVIAAKTSGATVTIIGLDGVIYPEVWEPYYETLALKIAAQAEIEAAKMLEEAKVTVEEPVVEEKAIELVASSEETVAPNGKNSVKATWADKNGQVLTFEGYDIYRAGVDGEYKFMFNTANTWYYNTLIRAGQKYSYKVKGYNTVNGEKVYTDFSTETACVVK